jgi:short-subunit dehydrogenase
MNKGLAIIIGASKGIGKCIAIGLANDGYHPVLIARNKERLTHVSEIIKQQSNQNSTVYSLDISDYNRTHDVIREIDALNKPIDIIVNSAAQYLDGTLDQSVEKFKHILEINVVSQYAVLKDLIPLMKKQQHGYVFNIASRAGKYGFPGSGTYGASKFALVGLSESLYRELAAQNIKVTTLCPGWVNTQMAKEANTPFRDDEMIQPEDILNAIRFLLQLSKNACIKELMIECTQSVL